MKRLLRSTLSDLTYQILRLTDGRPSGVRILTYHRVTDAHPGDRLCIPPQVFAEQMRWLHEAGYQTVTFAQAVVFVHHVTRDTGHETRDTRQGTRDRGSLAEARDIADGAPQAIPRGSSGCRRWGSTSDPSRKLGMSPMGLHKRQGASKPSSVQDNLSLVPCPLFPTLFDPRRSVVLTFDDGFEDNFLYAYPAMARYGFTGIFFIPSAFVLGGSDGHHAEDRPMTPEQLQDLLRAGHEIGAHSISHAKLTTLPADSMRQEVRGSKRALEERLRRPVDFFCYPSGDYNDAVKRAVEESGYRGACTVKPGANGPGADPFALRRTEVSACDSLRDVEKKLSGAYDWLHQAVQWRTRR